MPSVGTDRSGLTGSTGGVVSDQGSMLLSSDSLGETSLLFGQASTREIISGIANGDFAVPPPDPTTVLSDANPLPYWTFTDTSSGGSITASVVADGSAASGNALRFTIANNTASGKAAQISRYFPIPSSKSRSLWQGIEVTLSNISSTANATLTGRIDFFASDQTTQVYPGPTTTPSLAARTGTTATITTAAAHYLNTGDSVVIALTSGPTGYAALNGTYTITGTPTTTTFTYTTTTTGTITSGAAVGSIQFYSDLTLAFNAITTWSPDNSIQIPNYIAGRSTAKSGTPPPTAAYARVVITIATVGLVTPAASIDVNEVRNIRGFQEIVINDSTDPQSYPPAYINNSYGIMTVSAGLDASGQQAQMLLENGLSGAGGTVAVTSNLQVIGLAAGQGNIKLDGSITGNKSYASSNLIRGVVLQRTTTLSLATSIPASPTTANTTAISWTSAVKADTGMWSSGTAITAPLAGAYQVNFNSQFKSGTAYSVAFYVFVNNTVQLSFEQTASATSSYDINQLSGVLYLAANDVVVFRAAASTTGKTTGVDERNSFASVIFLGGWT
jgi:hypothetical protein